MGHLLALHVTPANEQEREQVGVLAEAVQKVKDENVPLVWEVQGYTGPAAVHAAAAHGIELEVVKLAGAKKDWIMFSGLLLARLHFQSFVSS